MEWVKIFSGNSEAEQRVPSGQTQLVVIGAVRICLAHHNEKFFAVQDSCSHSGASLSKGKINFLGDVVCPLHGYRFELKSGRACDSSSTDLKVYPIRIDESGFFIGL